MTTQNIRSWHNADMKELAEIRRDNFVRLLEEFKETHNQGRDFGLISAFSRYYDIKASHVSQIKNGTSNIGNPLARQIEGKAGKPAMWLDDEHHLVDMSDPKQVGFVEVVMTLYHSSPEHAREAILQTITEAYKRQSEKK